MGIAVLRRTTDRSWVNELWSQVAESPVASGAPCPSCGRSTVSASSGDLTLDVCKKCQMVWFDRGEAERAPVLPQRGTRTLPQDALQRIAQQQAELIARDYNRRYPEQLTVAEALPLVPGLAGLPLEAEQRGLSRYPFATWIVAAVLFVIGFWSLVSPEEAQRYGLLATDIDRSGGATFFTALFVHLTWFQFATNVYFLLVFGDNVEDHLGAATFLLLLLAGGLVGNAMHAILDADSATSLMGASGAISAITSFYALRFPSARLRFIRLFKWHAMPASAGLLFWFATKLASTQDILGRAEPNAWPYVGGAAVGLVFWWVLRKP
jgi:membrane associated rhomboid family serine protease